MLSASCQPNDFVFTSESVSEGHPDKICDQISDGILDAFLKEDPMSRVAVEVMVTTNKVVIAGEVRGPDSINAERMEAIARETIKKIGYEQDGFHWQKADIEVLVHQQSADIAMGVDESSDTHDEGAGDQGIMFGYAVNDTEVYMPAPITFAHKILRNLSEKRRGGLAPQLGPDAKSQVTLEYQNGKPVRATSVLVSTQHEEGVSQDDIREIVRGSVEEVLPQGWMCDDKHFFVNPTGQFVIGGPEGDCGLTGRKIIVDTYGGMAPHGGGAFSGKDPSKVDRSAAYMARYLAKNIVAAGLAEECLIQLAYGIGLSRPLAFYINLFDTGKVSEAALAKLLHDTVDLTPHGIRDHLQLNRPIYQPTSTYGHFGRQTTDDGLFPWEKLDLVSNLKKAFHLNGDEVKEKALS